MLKNVRIKQNEFMAMKILFQNEYIYDAYNYRICFYTTGKRILHLKKEIVKPLIVFVNS